LLPYTHLESFAAKIVEAEDAQNNMDYFANK
jgi:hypothetical protein